MVVVVVGVVVGGDGVQAELHAMQALLEQYYSRFGPLPAQ